MRESDPQIQQLAKEWVERSYVGPLDAEITQPSQERVILPNLTVSDLDRGGGVGVPDVGGSDLRAGEAAVAHVSHQSAVGGVDVRAQAETVGSIDYRKLKLRWSF